MNNCTQNLFVPSPLCLDTSQPQLNRPQRPAVENTRGLGTNPEPVLGTSLSRRIGDIQPCGPGSFLALAVLLTPYELDPSFVRALGEEIIVYSCLRKVRTNQRSNSSSIAPAGARPVFIDPPACISACIMCGIAVLFVADNINRFVSLR